MLGIFVGIAAVVALVSLGQGLQKYINEEFEKLGKDKIIVQPKGSFGPGSSGTVTLDKSDVDTVKKTVGIENAAGAPLKNVKIEFNDEVRYFYAFGMPTEGDEKRLMDELFLGYGIEAGRALKKGDKFKVNLGHYYLDRNLFEKNVKLGDKIKLNDIEFEVVGFYEIIGNPSDDQNIYVPREVLFEITNSEETYDMIYAKSSPGSNPQLVADRIEKNLRKHRNLEEGKEDFSIQTSEEFLKAFLTVFNIVQAVLVGIASISLVVGGVGIMNTMYTAVLERTKEIGVMKAIGARNSDILKLFIIESGILGLAGGAIGIFIGASFSKLIELGATVVLQSSLLKAYFPWYLILGALTFSFVIGTISGAIPAYQASKLKPVDALRYE